jgi:hypothetical protein
MATRKINELWVIMKTVKNRDNKDTFVEFITKCYTEKGYFMEKNVLEYTVVNMGETICFVNNLPIEPIRIAPGVESHYKHRFQTNDHEFDYTKYSFYFK